MPVFGSRFTRLRIVQTALWIMLPGFVLPLYAADSTPRETLVGASLSPTADGKDAYTINFKNVSIIEYIRFISRITGSNFVFDENDLQFVVTIVSEEPATLENIFSALIQVLRINNLSLLEHDGNYVITKNPGVTQIPSIVSSESHTTTVAPSTAIVTRVFRIKNTNVNSVATIIRTMVSQQALVSVSNETNQLIVSDIVTNIEQIATLLASLDAPHSPLDIESYAAKNVAPKDLITMAQTLVAPFAEGNPLIFVPQPETNTLFIVSTPHLIERTIAILQDLDLTPQTGVGQGSLFFYQLHNLPEDVIIDRLHQIADQLKQTKYPPTALINMLLGAHYVKDSSAIIFLGDASTFTKVKEILSTIDFPEGSQISFFIYPLKKNDQRSIQAALTQLATQLKQTKFPDHNLISVLETMKYMQDTDSFIFTGTQNALNQLQLLLPTLDEQVSSAQKTLKSSFFLYTPQRSSNTNFENALHQLAGNLKTAPTPDRALIEAIESVRYLNETRSFTFNGTFDAIERLQEILPTLDVPPQSAESTFYVYKLQTPNHDNLSKALDQFATNLESSAHPDKNLIDVIRSRRFIKDTNSFIFTGDQGALDRLAKLLPSFDSTDLGSSTGTTASTNDRFFIYSPQYRKGDVLLKAIQEMVTNLKASGLADPALLRALETAKWVPATETIVFTGDNATIENIKSLIPIIDSQTSMQSSAATTYFLYKLQYAQAQAARAYLNTVKGNLSSSDKNQKNVQGVIESAKVIPDNNAILLTGPKEAVEEVKGLIATYDTEDHMAAPVSFGNLYIYKAKNLPAKDVISSMQNLIDSLAASGSIDPALQKSVKGMHYVEASDSIVISGSDATLAQIKTLLEEVDVQSKDAKSVYQVGAKTFFIYQVQYIGADQLAQSLKSVAQDLKKGGLNDQALAAAINSMKEIPETNSLLFTGTPEALQEIQNLIAKFDLSSLAPTIAAPASFVIYRPKHVPGDELITMLCDFTSNLKAAGVNNPSLFDTVDNLRWIENTCSLLITGEPTTITKVQDLLQQFDIAGPNSVKAPDTTASIGETGFLIYKLQFHQGDDIQRALRRVASDLQDAHKGQQIPIAEAIESLQWIPVTNSLLTSGPPDVLSKVRELVQNLDIPLRQVFIEVLVIQTSVVNSQQFGLSWAGRASYMNKLAGQMSEFGPSPSGMSPGLGVPFNPINAATTPNPANFGTPSGFDLGVIGDVILHKGKTFFSLGSLLQAVENDTDSTIVMNPKIIAQDSNNATMFFGFNVPFQGSLVTNVSAQTNVTSSLEYRNVGHNLSITPTLGSGDLITLDISEDLSQVVNNGGISAIANASTLPIAGITTSQTTMATRVHVPDGHFVCLTGQITESKTHNRQQIPCLGGLPLIGAAFGSTQRFNDRENLIIFMRPQIVKTFDEYKRITEHQEDLYRTRASLPVVKEAIDDGIDMVKVPENE